MMRIVVTGAAGYIGSALADRLIQQGHQVLLIDNYYIESHLTHIHNIPIKNIDIRDDIDISDYDMLVHLAAISGINKCNNNQELAIDVNIRGTTNLLKDFKGRVIFASTSAVYGEAKHPTITEEHPKKPLGTYGNTKLEAERLIEYCNNYCILRFSNIYGKGLSFKRTVTDLFIEKALKGEPIEIDGDGRQRRDFVHINDVILAYWNAIRSEAVGTFNIGGRQALSVNDIAELVVKHYRRTFGYTLKVTHKPKDVGRKWHDFIYSCESAKQALGYEPSYSVSDEIVERFNAESKKQSC